MAPGSSLNPEQYSDDDHARCTSHSTTSTLSPAFSTGPTAGRLKVLLALLAFMLLPCMAAVAHAQSAVLGVLAISRAVLGSVRPRQISEPCKGIDMAGGLRATGRGEGGTRYPQVGVGGWQPDVATSRVWDIRHHQLIEALMALLMTLPAYGAILQSAVTLVWKQLLILRSGAHGPSHVVAATVDSPCSPPPDELSPYVSPSCPLPDDLSPRATMCLASLYLISIVIIVSHCSMQRNGKPNLAGKLGPMMGLMAFFLCWAWVGPSGSIEPFILSFVWTLNGIGWLCQCF